MHDSEAMAQLRAEVTGVPNLGGVLEPTVPKLRDVSETANTNGQANKLKAIQDSTVENYIRMTVQRLILVRMSHSLSHST